ncbi:MAG: hypothetical protein D3923_17645, partial [Candidatus Electrothrix sp. AR3]|nr:hypothetical protein [Candidatus Electrothrix sp. AR3]
MSLSVTLDDTLQLPQSFYARISNSYGYAWVGPVKLSGLNYHSARNTEAPGQPLIEDQPQQAEINSPVSIAVKAGISRDHS